MSEPLALALFARVGKITGKREVGPQFSEGCHHLHWAAIGVEKETAFRAGFGAQ